MNKEQVNTFRDRFFTSAAEYAHILDGLVVSGIVDVVEARQLLGIEPPDEEQAATPPTENHYGYDCMWVHTLVSGGSKCPVCGEPAISFPNAPIDEQMSQSETCDDTFHFPTAHPFRCPCCNDWIDVIVEEGRAKRLEKHVAMSNLSERCPTCHALRYR